MATNFGTGWHDHEGVVTNLQQQVAAQQQTPQQLQSILEAQRASATQSERARESERVASSIGRHVTRLESERSRGRIEGT